MENEPRHIDKLLKNNPYPGRGILIGKSPDGSSAVFAYFIMGRSENSRNRVFVETEDGVRTQAFDPSKVSDPSLIIYTPVRRLDNKIIISNGDQTDTIYDFISHGESFEQALTTREFEPDSPHYTPRISGLIDFTDKDFSYKLSILRRGANGECDRGFFSYSSTPGLGHFIHTYETDGTPLPSFKGEPVPIVIDGDIDLFTKTLWDCSSGSARLALYVSYISLDSGAKTTRIMNVNI
ncbi:MAG: IMP cyclohydrolase [Oscillospiraceae bacterium]|jgi:hypothetical protein|nr:IMP cyclohydrolase [Oscillospiraceae bacterium]